MPDATSYHPLGRVVVAAFLAFGLMGSSLSAHHALLAAPQSDFVSDDDRQFWSFQKVVRPAVPQVQNGERGQTPVDAFVLARLEAEGLTLSADADRRTLIRRAFLDLLGLAPSPAAVEAFVTDESPDAWERLVDQMLASPQFGERWGRHWLDV